MSHKTIQPRIVVGFSQTAASAAALLWAVREARLREAEVTPVHAWQWSGESRASYAPMANWQCREEELAAARAEISRAVSELAPALAPVIDHGPAVQVLLTHAQGADLLVLGSRGYDPEAPGPMGPVLAACLLRAGCPVVVVTPDAAVPEQRRQGRHGQSLGDDLALAGTYPREA